MELTRRNVARFRRILVRWARTNLRRYPWRWERDRFRLLLAEMMLRRTRADQVVPVYEETIKRYATAEELAQAPATDLENLLRPLGLRWRARDIACMAREVARGYGGRVPAAEEELRSLTGVGDYVAGAVACFGSGFATPIIDTNVARVMGRIFGLRLDGEARRRKEIRNAAQLCVDRKDPQTYHYALLDFAAKVCTATVPACATCPFQRRKACEYITACDVTDPVGQQYGL